MVVAGRTVRLDVAYHGAAFHGWQIQSTLRTVEGELTDAVATLLKRRVKVQGASRTDAGVHARGQVAHFVDDGARSCDEYYRALNRMMGRDVAVLGVREASSGFHARHSARGKIYEYCIADGFHLDPMLTDRVWHVPSGLDCDAMDVAARRMVGWRDFASFQASGCAATSTVRTMRRVRVRRRGDGLIAVVVEGDAFLKYMVRTMVGTLVAVGKGRHRPEWVDEVLAAKDRQAAGVTAPAHGLTLRKVLYPLR